MYEVILEYATDLFFVWNLVHSFSAIKTQQTHYRKTLTNTY